MAEKKIEKLVEVKIDQELMDILNDDSTIIENPEIVIQPKAIDPAVIIPETIKPPIQEPVQPEPVQPEPAIEPVIQSELPQVQNNPIAEQTDNSKQLNDLLKLFNDTCTTIVNNYATDRAQVNDALTYFESEVKAARKANLKLPTALIEGWVKLLAIKSEINSNATGALDSVAKLLAAAKNNNTIININDKKGSIDLMSILAQPTRTDEVHGVL